jgi:hypothetical protein
LRKENHCLVVQFILNAISLKSRDND